MNNAPDFTERRAKGCYENEVVNLFLLAVPEQYRKVQAEPKSLLSDQKDRIWEQVFEMKIDTEHGVGGHTAGWNAAIEAVLRVIDAS